MARTRRQAIQAELVRRRYCAEDDNVFAEFVDLMYGNKKTKDAIDAELSELIGPDYDPSFTVWLWRKAEAMAAGVDSDDNDNDAGGGGSSGPAAASTSTQDTSRNAPSGFPQEGSGQGRGYSRQDAGRSFGPTDSSAPSAARRPVGRQSGEARYDGPSSSAPSRRNGPRELFASALQQSRNSMESFRGQKRSMDMRSPSPVRDAFDASHERKRLAMDESGSSAPKQIRIRGIGASALLAAANQPPTGPSRPRAPVELFANRGQARPAEQSSGAASQEAGPSIFQRTQTGNAPVESHKDQADHAMEEDPAPVVLPTSSAHYNPLFFGGGGAGAAAPLTEPPLAARLSLMLPDNPPLPTSAPQIAPAAPATGGANDILEFPTRPLDVALCKYDLKCTNPMCRYSHATPSAANSDAADDALVLKQDACLFGPRCTKKDCVMSHPSPAVAIAYSKAGMLSMSAAAARPFYPSSGAPHIPSFAAPATGPPSWAMTPAQMRCRWQGACKNANCPFQHVDENGQTIPPPASQHQVAPTTTPDATMNTGTAASTGASADTSSKPSALDRALDDFTAGGNAMGGKRCKWGAECMRPDCMFGHPPTRKLGGSAPSSFVSPVAFGGAGVSGGAGAIPCRYGLGCLRADCIYSHPPGRAGGIGNGMVNRMARFNLPADTPMETIIPSNVS
ncbi:mRNA-binding protein nab2 [Tilletia horrida]|nr:mRNA-binding protein nab2 [Tilletia horrida]